MSVGKSTQVTVAQAGQEILDANQERKRVIIQNNDGAAAVVIKLDSLPADMDDGIFLDTNVHKILELDVTNKIFARSNQPGGAAVSILEIEK